jgi:dihydroxyacetone kinase-like predicted kinase
MVLKWFKSKKDKALEEKLKHLESLLISAKDKEKVEVHIHQLTIEGPLTDKLSFELDQIDIDELSGAFNLGNNFGVDILENQSHQKRKTKEPIQNKNGYSFRFDEKWKNTKEEK